MINPGVEPFHSYRRVQPALKPIFDAWALPGRRGESRNDRTIRDDVTIPRYKLLAECKSNAGLLLPNHRRPSAEIPAGTLDHGPHGGGQYLQPAPPGKKAHPANRAFSHTFLKNMLYASLR